MNESTGIVEKLRKRAAFNEAMRAADKIAFCERSDIALMYEAADIIASLQSPGVLPAVKGLREGWRIVPERGNWEMLERLREIIDGDRQFEVVSDALFYVLSVSPEYFESDDAALEPLPASQPEVECATEGCGKPATVHFIRGEIGSHYCDGCYSTIFRNEQERLATLNREVPHAERGGAP